VLEGQGYVLGNLLPGSDPVEASRWREQGAHALEERLGSVTKAESNILSRELASRNNLTITGKWGHGLSWWNVSVTFHTGGQIEILQANSEAHHISSSRWPDPKVKGRLFKCITQSLLFLLEINVPKFAQSLGTMWGSRRVWSLINKN
jgi:hypothetical protein